MLVRTLHAAHPYLLVKDKVMINSKREKYLGDILTSDAKIDINVLERCNKGIGIANQIVSILKEVSFGFYYFEMGLLFRSSMLINGILCSIEALYGLKKNHIEQLEQCDRMLMRRLFNCKSTTAIESYYLETNCWPLRFVIIARRLMFYWNILQKSDDELIKQVLYCQRLSPVKNDWCLEIDENLKFCNINLTEDEIGKMKKQQFKILVNSNIREVAREYLISLKSQHSKSKGLSENFKLQPYLSSNLLNLEEKQTLFQFRTRSIECKANYNQQYGQNLSCFSCNEEDNQHHFLSCSIANNINTDGLKYEDIFQTLDKQVKVTKALTKIVAKRKVFQK